MNEIKLLVDNENLETLLSVLNNLRDGLIKDIEINGAKKPRTTQYQPKINRIVKEEDSGTNDSSGKYANAAAYKARLKNKK